jgi:serine/threonine protein kinase
LKKNQTLHFLKNKDAEEFFNKIKRYCVQYDEGLFSNLEKIGSGSYSTVYKGMKINRLQPVAIKRISKQMLMKKNSTAVILENVN